MEDRAGVPGSPRPDGEPADGESVDADDIIAVPLSFEEYEEIERRRKRKHAVIVWSGIVLATVLIPIAYLKFIGQFSTAHLLPSQEAAQRAAVHGSRKFSGVEPAVYSVGTGPKRTPAEQARFDQLKGDLNDYVTRGLKRISPEEKVAVIGFANATGRNFKDHPTTMAALRTDVIPAQQKLVLEAGALRPRTKEVQALNALLLRSAKMKLLAYRQMLSGESDPDGLWKYAFDAEFKDAEDNAREFHTQLTQLTDETGVRAPL